MALTIVLALAILSVANYGDSFEFSGLNPLAQTKSQLKPTIKPFSAPTVQPHQLDQFKSPFGHNSIPGKPFGAPFGQSPPSYQPYQPFRANYQPFGPYPGYPGPVVNPGQGAYQGPNAYPVPSYRFDEPNHKPFGFQPFPAPAQPSFGQYKFGPSKKFNKNFPGLAEFNQPGKYFQEHQFGAYHGPEFSSAIIPAEHSFKQSKPKDILLGKPVVPTLSEFGLPKQTNFGFPSPPSFGYPALNFPAFQPFVSTVPSVKSVSATPLVPVTAVNVVQKFGGAEITTVVPATPALNVPEVTPAADPQPDSPAPEEVIAVNVSTAEVPTAAAEVPAAQDAAPAQDATPAQDVAPAQDAAPAQDVAPAPEQSIPSSEVNELSSAAAVPETQDSVKELSPVTETSSSAAAPANEPSESSTTGVLEDAKSFSVTTENTVVENSPSTESAAGAVSLPGLPTGLKNSQFADTSSLGVFGASGFQYFGQQAGAQPPSYYPYFDTSKLSEEELKAFVASFGNNVPTQSVVQDGAHKFSEEELKAFAASFGANVPTQTVVQGDAHKFSEEELKSFAASFGTNVQQSGQGEAHKFTEEELKSFAASLGTQSGQVTGSADATVTVAEGSFGSSPSSEIAAKIESSEKAVENNDKTAVNDEKKVPVESQSLNIPGAQKKFNTVQIIQDDPFNGQLPLLYDPSNGSPLDSYKFYSHPSVAALSSQATLASYSPESAFQDFGTQFRQGYLVEGSPSLTPITKNIVQSSQIPISISSVDHPLHSQVFKYSTQSFVPYPALIAGNARNTAVFPQTIDASTVASAPSTSAPDAAAPVSKSTAETAA